MKNENALQLLIEELIAIARFDCKNLLDADLDLAKLTENDRKAIARVERKQLADGVNINVYFYDKVKIIALLFGILSKQPSSNSETANIVLQIEEDDSSN